MYSHPVVLADQDRLELFAYLGRSRRLFQGAKTWTDTEGIAWTGTRAGSVGIALTWLGPGWVFDPVARQEREQDYQDRHRAMRRAGPRRHQRELKKTIGQ